MQAKPLFISTAVGTSIEVILNLLNTGLTLYILGLVDLNAISIPNYPMIFTTMPVAGCLVTIFGWIVSSAIGGIAEIGTLGGLAASAFIREPAS